MKYDKTIKSIINDINFNSSCYLEDILYLNECSATDRIVEKIIEQAKELEKYHIKQFKEAEKIDKGKNR